MRRRLIAAAMVVRMTMSVYVTVCLYSICRSKGMSSLRTLLDQQVSLLLLQVTNRAYASTENHPSLVMMPSIRQFSEPPWSTKESEHWVYLLPCSRMMRRLIAAVMVVGMTMSVRVTVYLWSRCHSKGILLLQSAWINRFHYFYFRSQTVLALPLRNWTFLSTMLLLP